MMPLSLADLGLLRESIDNLVNVLVPQTVLVAVLSEALGRIDHEDAGTRVGIFIVDHDDAGSVAGAIKKIRGQADYALDETLAEDPLANIGLDIAPKEHAMGHYDRAFAGAFE